MWGSSIPDLKRAQCSVCSAKTAESLWVSLEDLEWGATARYDSHDTPFWFLLGASRTSAGSAKSYELWGAFSLTSFTWELRILEQFGFNKLVILDSWCLLIPRSWAPASFHQFRKSSPLGCLCRQCLDYFGCALDSARQQKNVEPWESMRIIWYMCM